MIAAAAIVIGLLWLTYGIHREPRYNGKSLSEWLRLYGSVNIRFGGPEEAVDAVRHIGTNAVPFLVSWIDQQRDMPPWKVRLYGLAATHWKPGTPGRASLLAWLDPQPTRAQLSIWGFVILGPSARVAVPDLVRLARSPEDRSSFATVSLRFLGIEALWPILSMITNTADTTFQLRCSAMDSLGGMGYLGTNAHPGVVLLIHCLEDPDLATRAATALGSLHLESDISVPALVECTRSTNATLRKDAILSLGQFGRSARAAAPALTKLLDDPDASVRYAATSALELIAPEVSAP